MAGNRFRLFVLPADRRLDSAAIRRHLGVKRTRFATVEGEATWRAARPAWLDVVRLPNWGIFLQPLGFAMFLTAIMAENKRPPFDIPEAESELVNLLCEGMSLDEAAGHRGVTVNTARSQLKQAFAKTSTSRQSELVRLVLVGIPPVVED